MKFTKFEDIILFEDNDIIVINKPVEMASLDDKSKANVNFLAKRYFADAQLCHRLDKMTSGVLLIAKNPENYRNISMQFENRETKKVYFALVAGVHHIENLTIDLPLLISTNNKVTVNRKEGKPSQTVVNTEKNFNHYTVFRCEPITGRMHQIRVHLASLMFPIVGDTLYGGKNAYLSALKRTYKVSKYQEEEKALNAGYLLHANSLTFKHPATGEEMTVTAPLNRNFEAVLKTLTRYDL